MTFFVPVLLLFGFLTTFVHRGEDFPWLLSLVLFLMCAPTFVAAARTKKRKLAPLAVLCVFGFCVWALVGNLGVRFHVGPVLLGGSLLLAIVWSVLAVGALSIAVRLAARYARGRAFVVGATVVCTLLAGFVASPALFALGVTSYPGGGMYYGIPLVQHLFWLVSGLVVGGLGAWQYFETEDALPASTLTGGMYILAFCTGVATGEQLWLPAILGMLLVQYSFHLKSSL